MKWISYFLTFLKILINFGLMMKDEWLTVFKIFSYRNRAHSTAEVQFRSWKNLIVQISLTFSYKIRFWWFKYHWKDLNKIYTMRNPSLDFEMETNEINCWKEATFNLGHQFQSRYKFFSFFLWRLVSLIQFFSFLCKYHN